MRDVYIDDDGKVREWDPEAPLRAEARAVVRERLGLTREQLEIPRVSAFRLAGAIAEQLMEPRP